MIKPFNIKDAKYTIKLDLEKSLEKNKKKAKKVTKPFHTMLNEEIFNLTSLGILSSELQKIRPLNESEQYDVSKLYGNNKTISNMKIFDRIILKAVFPKTSKERLKKIVDSLHFNYGLNSNIEDKAEDNVVYVAKDFIKKRVNE